MTKCTRRPALIVVLAVVVIAKCSNAVLAQSADSGDVRIIWFQPETRTIHPGDVAISQLAIHNYGTESRLVWIGYSVSDPDGQWFDIEPDSITVRSGETSPTHRMDWRVPANPLPTAGAYRTVMAVWNAQPGTPGARRLATADLRDTFRVQWDGESIVENPTGLWRATRHRLGRGSMKPENVLVTGAGFQLRLKARSCDGAELRSYARFSSGNLIARIRTPNAPGSLSALFLFAGESGGNDEIDIEIYNDGSRKATLTSWIDGEKQRKADVRLPFDPAAGFHEYAILRSTQSLQLLADHKSLALWTGGYSRGPMHALLSAWFPSWLDCRPPADDAVLSVDWIRLPGDAGK